MAGPLLGLEASIWPERRVYHRVWGSRGWSCCLGTRTGWAGSQTAGSCTGPSGWRRGPWHMLLEHTSNWFLWPVIGIVSEIYIFQFIWRYPHSALSWSLQEAWLYNWGNLAHTSMVVRTGLLTQSDKGKLWPEQPTRGMNSALDRQRSPSSFLYSRIMF